MATRRKPKVDPVDDTVADVVDTVADVEQEAPRKTVGVSGDFPLDRLDYFTVMVTTRRGHHGATVEDRAAIRMIQQEVGVEPTGHFDDATAGAVRAWREEHGLVGASFVDAAAWKKMATPWARSAAPSGGVDGADEPDDPTGELDPPQGPE